MTTVSRRQIREVMIPPGQPYWNGAVKSFYSTFKRRNCWAEGSLRKSKRLRAKLLAWQQDYNGRRLHSVLGYQTPEERWHRLTLKNPLDKRGQKRTFFLTLKMSKKWGQTILPSFYQGLPKRFSFRNFSPRGLYFRGETQYDPKKKQNQKRNRENQAKDPYETHNIRLSAKQVWSVDPCGRAV